MRPTRQYWLDRDPAILERERLILQLRADGWTYRAIGSSLGITKERVVQLERRAKRHHCRHTVT